MLSANKIVPFADRVHKYISFLEFLGDTQPCIVFIPGSVFSTAPGDVQGTKCSLGMECAQQELELLYYQSQILINTMLKFCTKYQTRFIHGQFETFN